MIGKTQLNRDLSCLEKIDKCVIYNWPDYSNPGDHVLSLGVLLYLIEQHDAKILNIGTKERFTFNQIENVDTIVFVGGGNFGSLYPQMHDVSLKIIEKYPKKRIVFFPVSVYFNNTSYLVKTQDLIRKVSNIFIFCREQESYSFVERHFNKAKKQLVPDMAFYLEEHIKYFKSLLTESNVSILRDDKERLIKLDEPSDSWGDYSYYFMNILKKYVNPDFIKYPYMSLSVLLNSILMLANRTNFKTDRLHAHILSTILENPHMFLSNTYHKNKSFYETWTHKFEFVEFLES
jgi:pyruvyl transferase EpsO